MDLNHFLSNLPSAPSGAFNSRYYYNQGLPDEVRELACLGLKLFPVSLAAKLVGDHDRWIADATDDISLLEELSPAPLWGYRLALGPSGLCVLILDGTRASFEALAPDLEECLTLQARCGDKAYVFFRQPAGRKRIFSARKLAPGVSILGDGESCIVAPFGGAVWVDPHAEIELPYFLRELMSSGDRITCLDARCLRQSLFPALLLAGLPCIPPCGPIRLRARGTRSAASAEGTAFPAAGSSDFAVLSLRSHTPNRPATLSHGIAGRKGGALWRTKQWSKCIWS